MNNTYDKAAHDEFISYVLLWHAILWGVLCLACLAGCIHDLCVYSRETDDEAGGAGGAGESVPLTRVSVSNKTKSGEHVLVHHITTTEKK